MERLGQVCSAALLLAALCLAPLAEAKAYGGTRHYALDVQKAKVGTFAPPSCILACRPHRTGTGGKRVVCLCSYRRRSCKPQRCWHLFRASNFLGKHVTTSAAPAFRRAWVNSCVGVCLLVQDRLRACPCGGCLTFSVFYIMSVSCCWFVSEGGPAWRADRAKGAIPHYVALVAVATQGTSPFT
jgi:hypothetical protein